jgi:hypothetical protein
MSRRGAIFVQPHLNHASYKRGFRVGSASIIRCLDAKANTLWSSLCSQLFLRASGGDIYYRNDELEAPKKGTLVGAVLNDRAGKSMTAKRKASELLNESTDKVNQPIDYCYV